MGFLYSYIYAVHNYMVLANPIYLQQKVSAQAKDVGKLDLVAVWSFD
jgi:hypothetical protein